MKKSDLSTQVASVMDERGLSFRAMSNDIGLGSTTCYRIARGIGEPRPRTVILVCTYLDIPLKKDMFSSYVDDGELEVIKQNAKERIDFIAMKNGKRVVIETR